jgi:hypothetical protein
MFTKNYNERGPPMNSNIISTFHAPDRNWTLHNGDVEHALPTLSPNSFSGAFCDPPYGLSFMENEWDQAVPSIAIWEQVLRLCKPGAYLLAFGGTRTFHRMVCNIEDAGWEMRPFRFDESFSLISIAHTLRGGVNGSKEEGPARAGPF